MGGVALDSFTWNGTAFVDGPCLGGSFASPLSLIGGTTYFVGMTGWAAAVGTLGPNSGAGVNWVDPPLGPPAENLGIGSSYLSSVTVGTFDFQPNPVTLGSTDQGILRFIAADPVVDASVPEPASLVLMAFGGVFVGGLYRKRKGTGGLMNRSAA